MNLTDSESRKRRTFLSFLVLMISSGALTSCAQRRTVALKDSVQTVSSPWLTKTKAARSGRRLSALSQRQGRRLTVSEESFHNDRVLKEVRKREKEGTNKDLGILVWFVTTKETAPEQRDMALRKRYIRRHGDGVLKEIEGSGAKILHRYEAIPGLALQGVTEKLVRRLLKHPRVRYLALDGQKKLSLAESRVVIGADQAENALNATGNGVTICTIDSGVNHPHPALGAGFGPDKKVRAGINIIASKDNDGNGSFNDPGDLLVTDPLDNIGHGSHVIGDAASEDAQFRGIAPDARIAAAKAFSKSFFPFGFDSDIVAGLDFCMQQPASQNLKVVNMSFGAPPDNDADCSGPFDPALAALYGNGIFLVAASGNEQSLGAISYPACSKFVASVGASYDASFGQVVNAGCTDNNVDTGTLTCFGNRSQDLDFVAPGARITSVDINNGLGSSDPFCTPVNGPAPQFPFAECAGTSFSAPQVAGLAALLYEKNPNLTPAQVKGIIREGGTPISDPVTGLTFPLVNAFNSVRDVAEPVLTLFGAPAIAKTVNILLSAPKDPNLFYTLLLALGDAGITTTAGKTIQLSPDPVFFASFLDPASIGLSNAKGQLDSLGNAVASLAIPLVAPSGLKVFAAFVTHSTAQLDPASIISISPPINFTFLPNGIINFLKSLPASRGRMSCSNRSGTDQILCFGGKESVTGGGVADVLAYDVPSNSYSTIGMLEQTIVIPFVGEFPVPYKFTGSCVEVGSKFFCFGNSSVSGGSNLAVIFDGFTSSQVTLPVKLSATSCVLSGVNGKIYCFGGLSNGALTNKIFEFDPQTSQFIVKNAVMPVAAQFVSCVEDVFSKKIICFGGSAVAPILTVPVKFAQSFEYDPASDMTTQIDPLPSGRSEMGIAQNSVTGKIYLFGGEVSPSVALFNTPSPFINDILEYDPLTKKIRVVATNYPIAAAGISCAEKPETQKIYCFGGLFSAGFTFPGIPNTSDRAISFTSI